jgi:hypothetical protein
MTPKELIIAEAEKVHQQLKESLQSVKKIALNEAWRSLQLVTASTVQIIESTAKTLEGKDKKDIAIEYINNFYDKAFLIIDIPFVPSVVEPIIHGYIKKILMIMVSASIDATVTIFRETGIFLKKGTA